MATDMETRVEKAVQMILENRYLDLSTTKGSKPWIAALYYAVDQHLNFYFVSHPESRHARHLRENSYVAISIWDSRDPPSEVDGLQIEAIASPVSEDNLSDVLEIYYRKRFENSEKRDEYINASETYKGDTHKEFYRIKATKVYKLDVPHTEYDKRVIVDEEALSQRLAEIENDQGLGNAHHESVRE